MGPLQEALGYCRGHIDWEKTEFDLRKAYVCSLFSELAYWKIADFEYGTTKRSNVIPCAAYQDLVRRRTVVDFDTMLRDADIATSFSVIRRYAVAVGVRTPTMIIISVRGTQPLYDWLANCRVTRFPYRIAGGTAWFHTGFFRAAMACLGPVLRELQKLRQGADTLPIYITGHSLGGAIAAILNNLLHPWFFEHHYPWKLSEEDRMTKGCYTFGMPRYGDLFAIVNTLEPYHLYNDADIVPNVPPRWMGFDNTFNEYRLDGAGIENLQSRGTLSFLAWLGLAASGRGIAAHQLELYRDRIREHL